MTKILTFSISILLLITFNSCAQATPKGNNNIGYTIEPGIKDKTDKKVIVSDGLIMASLDIKMFENDSVIWDTYAKGESIDQCIIMASLDNDTINITGFLGLSAALGYQIVLTKDTCIVTCFAKSDAEIYKLKKTDALNFGVSVPCETYRLTLAAQPKFKKGAIAEGMIELMSEDYYEVDNGKENKIKVQLTGYFKTNKLKRMGGR